MYRPNRIGPWPLVNIDGAPTEPTAANLNSTKNVMPTREVWLSDTVVNLEHRAETFVYDEANIVFTSAYSWFGIGIQVNGSNPGSGEFSRNYLVQYSIACDGIWNDQVNLNCIMGRADTLIQTPTLSNYSVLPIEHFNVPDGGGYRGNNFSANGVALGS